MFTFLIIGFVLLWGCFIYHIKVYEPVAQGVGLAVFAACCVLGVVSTGNSENIPAEYVKIESYSYVTESGSIETLAGPFYTKDGAYYEKDTTRVWWVPFASCDFVEVDLPKSAINYEPTTTNQCPNCHTSCSTPYCGQCGVKIN